MKSRLPIQTAAKPAVTIARPAVKASKLVYVGVANKSFPYPAGRSRIVYIGTTRAGVTRVAHSAALKARDLFPLYGVRELKFYVVTCKPRPGIRTWEKLERGLLITFREMFGEVPKANKAGRAMHWRDETQYFTHKRLRGVIEKYS